MRSTSVSQGPCGVAKRLVAAETTRDVSSIQMECSFVPTGNAPLAAPVLEQVTTTNVEVAGKTITELRHALEARKNKAFTPYQPETWHRLLTKHHLLSKYPFLPHSLQYGFDARIPTIYSTFTPDNSPTIYAHPQQYQELVNREFNTGRYFRPLSRVEVGGILSPFQSSPLSLIPKPGKPDKCWGVHNFSFPHSPQDGLSSINHSIESNNFPCTWGTFAMICTLIWHLPPGSQASICDVAEAYRTVPIVPSQWPGLVVKLHDPDQFAINTSDNFGISSAEGVYRSVADAGTDLFHALGISPLSKWVDDHIFFQILQEHLPQYNKKCRAWRKEITTNGGHLQDCSRYWFQGQTMPNGQVMEFDEDANFPFQDFSSSSPDAPKDAHFTYNEDDIDQLSDELGIPWEKSKTIPFTHSIPYLGFMWDLQTWTVAIPPSKKGKYLDAIREWNTCPTHALEDMRKMYGKLLHATLVVPAGRAYLVSLEAMLSTFNNHPFVPHHAPREAPNNLKWWAETLSRPILSHAIPGPSELIDTQA